MTRVWGWGDVVYHDTAVDLYNKGYRSMDRWRIQMIGYSENDTKILCAFLRDIESHTGRRW